MSKTNDAGECTSMSVKETLEQRGGRYGSFSNGAQLSQVLKNTFNKHVAEFGQPADFTDSMNEAIEIIFQKLSRIANGDPTYDDNWRDIAGYSQLIVDEIHAK